MTRVGWFRTLPVTVALIAAGCLAGCGVGPFPGGRLDGTERSLAAVDTATLEDVSIVLLETRPDAPYSVRVQLFRVSGNLYLDPAPKRRWLRFIEANPRVRIQFPGAAATYRARAVQEEDPEVLNQFAEDLVILRLDPD